MAPLAEEVRESMVKDVWRKGFIEKVSFEFRVKEWRGDGWRKWLPSQLQTFGQYQIILFGDRGRCVDNLPRVATWYWCDWESKLQPL